MSLGDNKEEVLGLSLEEGGAGWHRCACRMFGE